MNRRAFLETLAKAAAGFTILPAATTYARTWIRRRELWVIDWEDIQIGQIAANNEANMLYECVMIPPERTVLRTVTHIVNVDVPGWIENFSGVGES